MLESPQPATRGSSSEFSARIDLAAAHRIGDALGWSQLIYNHFTLRVPGEPNHFLVKPHDLMFAEVTASSLVKVDLAGRPVNESINLSAPGFIIHSAVLGARRDVNAVVHIHTETGMAIAAHGEGLRYMSQAALRFYQRISYHAYDGPNELDERDSLARDLGVNKAMILRNHGLLTCGDSIAEAMSLMHYLVSACRAQLMLEATRAEIMIPSREICERAGSHWDAFSSEGARAEWPAMLRWANRLDSSFRL